MLYSYYYGIGHIDDEDSLYTMILPDNAAWDKAYEADSISIFGGIVALNAKVEKGLAEKLSKIFLEIIIAPDFSDEALEILTRKKNIRLMKLDTSLSVSSALKYTNVNADPSLEPIDHH